MPELKTPQNKRSRLNFLFEAVLVLEMCLCQLLGALPAVGLQVLMGHLPMLPLAVMALGTGLCRFPAPVLAAGLYPTGRSLPPLPLPFFAASASLVERF
jgi:hypothetical protein